MPRYDFRCSFCGPFERIVPIREITDVAACPDCGEAATRVFGSPQVFSRLSPVRRALAAERPVDRPAARPRARPAQEP